MSQPTVNHSLFSPPQHKGKLWVVMLVSVLVHAAVIFGWSFEPKTPAVALQSSISVSIESSIANEPPAPVPNPVAEKEIIPEPQTIAPVAQATPPLPEPSLEPKAEPKAQIDQAVIASESPSDTLVESQPTEPEQSTFVVEAREPRTEPDEPANESPPVDLPPTKTAMLTESTPIPVAEPTQLVAQSSTPPISDADYLSPQFQNGVPMVEKPDLAAKRRWKGTVLLRGRVNTQGELENLTIYKSSGYDVLDESAVVQATNWLFEPARVNQTPTAHWVQIPVVFR